jgi:hypothetical protein
VGCGSFVFLQSLSRGKIIAQKMRADVSALVVRIYVDGKMFVVHGLKEGEWKEFGFWFS